MKISLRSLEYIFFLIASSELSAHVLGYDALHLVTKPLLVWMLALIFHLSVRDRYTSFHKAIFTGLGFSWLGDIFLLFQDKSEIYFILGLVSFLIAHVAYIYGFNQSVKGDGKPFFFWGRPILGFPFLALGVFVYITLYPNLGSLTIPVGLYTLVLLLMVLFSLNRQGRVVNDSFRLVFYGALFFMLSDMLLALNKFGDPFSHAGLAIMGTYIVAQYLIVKGSILQS